MTHRRTIFETRGMIPPQIPKYFGCTHDPALNLFRAKRLLKTFAEAQCVIEEYRQSQKDPNTQKPVLQYD